MRFLLCDNGWVGKGGRCIKIYDSIATGIFKEGEKILIAAQFNVYPRDGINLNDLFLSILQANNKLK